MSEADEAGSTTPETVLRQAQALLERRDPRAAEALLRSLLATSPQLAAAWNALGRALNNLGRMAEAEQALSTAVGLAPDLADAWLNLAHVRRGRGQYAEAEQACRQAMAEAPGSTQQIYRAQRMLASLYLLQGRPAEAADLLGPMLDTHPDDPGVLRDYADALRDEHRLAEARDAYLRYLRLAPEDHDALAALGIVRHGLDEHEAAAEAFRRVLARDPAHAVARQGLIWTLEIKRDFDGALDQLQPLLTDSPPPWAVVTAARMLRRLDRLDEARTMLEGFDTAACGAEDRATVHATLGEVFDACGEYEAAFRQFSRANACLPNRFDAQGFRGTVERLAAFFTAERLVALPDSGVRSDTPVFIVGMPRSGTSLIEQIIASHPGVEAGGERTDIYRLPRQLSGGDPAARWPECLLGIDAERLTQIAGAYLQAAPGYGRSPARITDKLPANYLNLGLIQMLLPGARVIYCRRDPMDTGLSCFQQNFRSEGMDFARDLGHIGLQQQACLRLMEHWQRQLALPIHVVDYELLVEDPDSHVPALVDFIGLPWDDACLDFHRSARLIRTASYEQVRQPIYASSVGRWRHYAPWLAPLATALEAPWVTQTGSAGP